MRPYHWLLELFLRERHDGRAFNDHPDYHFKRLIVFVVTFALLAGSGWLVRLWLRS